MLGSPSYPHHAGNRPTSRHGSGRVGVGHLRRFDQHPITVETNFAQPQLPPGYSEADAVRFAGVIGHPDLFWSTTIAPPPGPAATLSARLLSVSAAR